MGKTGGVASTERSGTGTRRTTRVAVTERADARPAERGGSDPAEATFAAAAGAAIGAAADAEIAANAATEADSQASQSAASAAISDAESVAADTAADVAHETSLAAHTAEVLATDAAARAATSILSFDPMPVVPQGQGTVLLEREPPQAFLPDTEDFDQFCEWALVSADDEPMVFAAWLNSIAGDIPD
jgi:hypothetical protein